MHNSPSREGFRWITSQKNSMLVCSLVLPSPDIISHPCSASDSVTPGPDLPESFRATDSTASYMMLTRIKIGVSS